jgi:NAD(P)H-dependent FMN reductase
MPPPAQLTKGEAVSQLQLIVGSTRPTRAADIVIPWVVARATAHGEFEVDVLDLRDWPLPIFSESLETVGDFADPTYSDPIVRRWNKRIKGADAYVLITPEYNHSIPGVLKNAIDNVFVSFALRNKPFFTVAYSGGIAGGVRAIEHLAQIGVEAELVPLRSCVVIPHVTEAFNEYGDPINPVTDLSIQIALDDLAWWSSVLMRARSDGELPPAAFRLQAGALAAHQVEDDAL